MKKNNSSTNFKKLKKVSTTLIVGSAIASIVSLSIPSNLLLEGYVSKFNAQTNSLIQSKEGTGTTAEQNGGYTVSSNPSPTNKYANEITSLDIQKVLTAPQGVSTFTVVALPVTEKNISEGSVYFLIYQTKKNNGSDTTSTYTTEFAKNDTSTSNGYNVDQNVLNQYKANEKLAQKENVFSTKEFSVLNNWIKSKSYQIKWKTDAEIKNYIQNKTTPGLTAEDVWLNLLDNAFLPTFVESNSSSQTTPNTTIEVKEITNKIGSVGLYQITVTINGVATSTEKTTSPSVMYLGGFLTDSGQRYEMTLNGTTSLSSYTISLENLFDSGENPANKNSKITDLTPSEFCSPNDKTASFIDVLTQNKGLSGGNEKILSLSYGNLKNIQLNKSQTTDNEQPQTYEQANSSTITADSIANSLKINSVNPVPNDSDGSLQLVVNYKTFDVYSGKTKDVTNTFSFPAGTFKINPNASSDLFIEWKSVDALPNMQYSYEVINEYYKNKDDQEFVRLFTNRFLNTSTTIQNMPRKAEISYAYSPDVDTNGNLTSSTSDNSLSIKLTFDNWGNTGKSFEISNIFTFKGYQYSNDSTSGQDDVINFNWKSNKTVLDENPSFRELQPSTIALNLITENNVLSTTLYKTFIAGDTGSNSSQTELVLEPNDSNGSMMVFIRKKSTTTGSDIIGQNTHIYQQLFVGFKAVGDSANITSFAFIPQSEVSDALLAIPLTSVTKTDVIELYLNEISLFKNRVLTEDNVEIIPVIKESGESYLTVKVTIPTFNQSNISTTVADQTFFTIIKGFSTNISNNLTKFDPPKDLTAIISISSSIVISVVLGLTLLGLLLRRARIRTFLNKNDLKDNKKSKKDIKKATLKK